MVEAWLWGLAPWLPSHDPNPAVRVPPAQSKAGANPPSGLWRRQPAFRKTCGPQCAAELSFPAKVRKGGVSPLTDTCNPLELQGFFLTNPDGGGGFGAASPGRRNFLN